MSLLSKSRRRWWVEAAGKVWGPYADSRLIAFADEGRIGAQTLVAPSPDGPFLPVRQHPELADLFTENPSGAPAPAPAPRPVVQPIPLRSAAAAPQPTPYPPAYRPEPLPQPPPQPAPVGQSSYAAPAQGRALLVWASVGGSGLEPFEQLLAMHGPHVRLGQNLWLVRAKITASGLRNALTRRLRGAEALVVVEASLADAAWFNLDGDTDRAARGLWVEP